MNNIDVVKSFLLAYQNKLCAALENQESNSDTRFHEDAWTHDFGSGKTRVLCGETFEQAGVNFSHVVGDYLPQAATLKRPDLMGASFIAMGISSVIHPKNPFVPTSHLNIRYFQAIKSTGEIVWWFGGGFDLTPYYGFDDDCVHWHQTAKNVCDKTHPDFYEKFKKAADDYFYLKHRKEHRGIGGIFFDDVNELSFDECFAFLQNVGNGFIDAYIPIVQKRKSHPYTEKNREFQLYRRGRYVEFNLLYDRGTLFGLQFGSRMESILVSLPPLVRWEYNFQPANVSEEEKLTAYFLKPKIWI